MNTSERLVSGDQNTVQGALHAVFNILLGERKKPEKKQPQMDERCRLMNWWEKWLKKGKPGPEMAVRGGREGQRNREAGEEEQEAGTELLTVPCCYSGKETILDLDQESMLGSATRGWEEIQEGTFVTGKSTQVHGSLDEWFFFRPGLKFYFWNEAWVNHMIGKPSTVLIVGKQWSRGSLVSRAPDTPFVLSSSIRHSSHSVPGA